jgi:ketosteroid isomerase-like protein
MTITNIMSHDDSADVARTPVETVRSCYAALANADMGALMANLRPDVVWTDTAGGPYHGTYVGPNAVVQGVFARISADWQDFAAAPDMLVAEDARVVAVGTYRARCRQTGRSVAARFAHVFVVDDGRVREFEQILDSRTLVEAMTPYRASMP